jgi:integrase/recombinase XerD
MERQVYCNAFELHLKTKKYSEKTIRMYTNVLSNFLLAHKSKINIDEITKQDIASFIGKAQNGNTQRTLHLPLKIFFTIIVNQPEKLIGITLVARKKKIPVIIERDFLLQSINLVANMKHKAILVIGYAAALRSGQIINIQLVDVNRATLTLTIRDTQERPFRKVQLSQRVITQIYHYINVYVPTKYLFNGANSARYSIKSLQNVVQKNIGDGYTMEMIRNSSIATLLESGNDIKLVQKHLGHSNIKLTRRHLNSEKYIPVKIKLPI